MVWIDALDYPFNKLMQLSFFEPFPGGMHANARSSDYTTNWTGLTRPAWQTYKEEIPLANLQMGRHAGSDRPLARRRRQRA